MSATAATLSSPRPSLGIHPASTPGNFTGPSRRRASKLGDMQPTRTSLIQRVRDQSDADSWREFVSLYEPLLLSYVKNRGLSEIDAGDVVQDIFILLLRALPSFQLDHSRGRFRTWLWQVMMNALADRARKSKTRGRAEDEYIDRSDKLKSGAEVAEDEDWISAHRRRVLEFVLPKVQAKTQEKTWTCFEQHILKNRSGAEVGAEVGLSANAVCVNAARVLAKVRELCADYMEELGDE
ncbi:MAG: sigma-70 family RNA polymerase sigma factor [Gemmataceae bacterium]|nr:sigma-70 family RNA polymerase sigma factor [Gemmataceae bacterium]